MGFKRKRNAEQREKQRASQRRYDQRRQYSLQLIERITRLANGQPTRITDEECIELVGCSPMEFESHMRSTVAHGYAHEAITPRFHVPLKKFDLHNPEQRRRAVHFSNLYAVQKEASMPGGYRRRKIPRTVEEARNMAWV